MKNYYPKAITIYIVVILAVILLSSRCIKIEEVVMPYYDTTYVIIKDSSRVLVSDTVITFINDTNYIVIYIYDTIRTITIGSQEWMDKDLHTLYYNDGTAIKLSYDNNDWSLNEPACCYYLNDSKNGILYNWYAVETGKLCPIGFRVSSEDDWKQLETFLGPDDIRGGKLKEKGLTHWKYPNLHATDEYGWTAIPTYFRYYNGEWGIDNFYTFQAANYWTSTIEPNDDLPIYKRLQYDNGYILWYRHGRTMGFAVRCIKN